MIPTALITGASGKLGNRIAAHLSARGFHLVLHGFGHTPCMHAADDEVLRADLSGWEGVKILERRLGEGDIGLFVNCASLFMRGSYSELDFQQLSRIFAINVHAPTVLTRALALGRMGAGNPVPGHVIHLLDSKILLRNSRYAAYTLSRKTLVQAAEMAALEYPGILRVNAICPKEIGLPETGETIENLLRIMDGLLDDQSSNSRCLFLDGSERALASFFPEEGF
ncbi:MAG TPA: SDR family NAD(P)-dependent oxidoreductase [Spirochaetota bacterium]|nr:SDR family NAD(P)-dependent oxidoreductase [Spirochaetota bacterium]HPH01758.1 SDR family NAD(P)-dependent oxidoreductase [Spirochaetota bacterium]HPN82585.1 SDR family NAD(P)-dependent oxidoreductase [Spirochaetota bacterium]